MSLLVERYFRPKMCAGTFYGFCKFSRISAMGSVSAEREAIQQYIRILYMVMDYTMQECVYIYIHAIECRYLLNSKCVKCKNKM